MSVRVILLLIIGAGIAYVLAVLAACGTTPAPRPPTAPVAVRTFCLPMPAYTREQEAAQGRDFAALPLGSPLAAFVTDAIALRDANRAACASQGH